MDFSHVNQGSRKSGKFVLVAALHVALGVMFVHGMNTRKLTVSHEPIIDLVPTPAEEIKPPPPPPPKFEFKPTAKPQIVVPPIEDVIVDKAKPDVVRVVVDDGHDVVAPRGPEPVIDQPKVIPARPSAMHTAVLADANACALPAYPKSAIRNEETGVTTLALLVGTDGRVTSARVEHSSGYRELDRAAVDALSLCRFKPATNNGVAEAGWAKLAYEWRLD